MLITQQRETSRLVTLLFSISVLSQKTIIYLKQKRYDQNMQITGKYREDIPLYRSTFEDAGESANGALKTYVTKDSNKVLRP